MVGAVTRRPLGMLQSVMQISQAAYAFSVVVRFKPLGYQDEIIIVPLKGQNNGTSC